MKSRIWIVFLLLAGFVSAQDPVTMIRRVRVRVSFASGTCGFSTQVRLVSRGGPVVEGLANEQCVVDFPNVPAGTYHVIVSGQNLPDTDTGSVAMDSVGSNEFEVRVTRANEVERANGATAIPLVSAVDLAVPIRAQKEFDKANSLMAKQNFSKATESLNRAITIYPSYANAYNNLGVIYAREGDHVREREALQKAISINDHFAPAYVNLGRLDISTNDFPSAESALNKAAAYDPTDAMTLVLLTYAEFMNHHFDETIATSRKAHTLQGAHAFVHQVAARAYEQKRDGASAIGELQQFLQEEPTGSRADIARKELAEVQGIVRASHEKAALTAAPAR
jgi:tetratricopeptide (TPR) repeat protein